MPAKKSNQNKNPVSTIRSKVFGLQLARIQMGQLSGCMPVNDTNRFRKMLFGFKFQELLMKGKLFSMLVRKLITAPGQSTLTPGSSFRCPVRLAKHIVSRQNPKSKNELYTFKSSMFIHRHKVTGVVIHSEKIIATASLDHTAKVVDLLRKEVFTLKGHKSGVTCVAIHQSGLLVATGCNDSSIKLWNFQSGSWTCIATLQGHTDVVTSLAFHNALPLLVSGSNDDTAKVWLIDDEMISAHCVTTLTGHTGDVNAAAFHPSLPLVATASDDGTVKMWLLSEDFSSYKELTTLTGHSNYVTSVAFHPVLPILATGCRDSNAKIWLLSAEGTSATCIADLDGHHERILSVAFHSFMPLLATCGYDKAVKLWLMSSDLSSVSCVANLIGHNGPITSAIFDGDHLLTSGSDGTVKAW
jgi:WD40 repeat protein